MRKKLFTPGPWLYKATGHRVYIRGEATDGSNEVCELNEQWVKPRVVSANAHLIAAAPELLDALEFVRDKIADECSDPYILDTVEQMDAAITSAYGDKL